MFTNSTNDVMCAESEGDAIKEPRRRIPIPHPALPLLNAAAAAAAGAMLMLTGRARFDAGQIIFTRPTNTTRRYASINRSHPSFIHSGPDWMQFAQYCLAERKRVIAYCHTSRNSPFICRWNEVSGTNIPRKLWHRTATFCTDI